MDKRVLDFFSNKLNKAERVELLKEADANIELKRQLLQQKNMHSFYHLHAQHKDEKEGRAEFSQFMLRAKKKKNRRLFVEVSKYAAIILLAIVSTVVTINMSHNENETIAYQEVYAPAGQRAEVILPDGTKVWLNANSKIVYASRFGAERNVKLTGEGFFKVSKDKNRPFIVSTYSGDIQALGTEFNVQSYPGDKFSVYLAEGSVKVYKHFAKHKGVVMKVNELLQERNGKFIIHYDPDAQSLLWKDGIYAFNNESLANIVKRLASYYNVTIEVKNEEIYKYRYTGKFRQKDSVIDILKVIQKIHHFKIDYNSQCEHITLY